MCLLFTPQDNSLVNITDVALSGVTATSGSSRAVSGVCVGIQTAGVARSPMSRYMSSAISLGAR